MKIKPNIGVVFLVLLFLVLIYGRWFWGGEIIGGDWPYFWRETLRGMFWYPYLWASWQGNGLGGINPLLGLQLFQSFLVAPFVNWLGLPWVIVYKIGWFGLFIAVSLVGSKSLWEAINPRLEIKKKESENGFPGWILTALIFITNTYILMVTGGGQMGVALAYAVAPLVLSSFLKLVNVFAISLPSSKFKVQSSKLMITAELVLALQIMLDLRIAYVTLFGVGIYYLLNLKSQISKLKTTALMVVPITVAGILNAFWLLPMVIMRHNPLQQLGGAYTSVGALKFFSFADFSHALSLLHPNWPENLFGKTYFLQPEFLIWPLLAFTVLISKKASKPVHYFALLALVGAFLAKGVNPPFGEVYRWLFERFPGFVMFRDPTKFYLLTAISYAVLIPVSLDFVGERLASIKGKRRVDILNTKYLILILFFLFWLFTIRQAILGQLSGTFARREVPPEYVELKDFLHRQPEFFRTLWVPRQQRFTYGTFQHQPSEAEPLFASTNSAQLAKNLQKKETPELFSQLGIKYVIIPFDSLGELFLKNRQYETATRQEYEKVLDQVPWLRKLSLGKLTVYATPGYKDRFWLESGEELSYQTVNPGQYLVNVSLKRPATLFFSESFHSGWQAQTVYGIINSQRTNYGLNSFQLERSGSYTLKIYFAPQKYVDIGVGISLVALLTSFGLLTWFVRKDSHLLPK